MEKMTIEEQLIKGFEFVDAFIGASKQLEGEVVLSMVAVMLDAKFGADSVNKAIAPDINIGIEKIINALPIALP